jgi:hypothetical protein
VYSLLVLAGILTAVILAGWRVLVPVVFLSPFIITYLYYDSRYQGRNLIAEVAGPLGLAASAPAIALAAHWSWAQAGTLWVILMARAIPSIFYVRARLRLERGHSANRLPAIVLHLAFAAVLWQLWRYDLSPLLAVAAVMVLLFRGIWGLSAHRLLRKTRQIGFLEIGFGLVYVVLVAVGFWVGV